MNTQILKHITNYTISASNEEGIKLEGDFQLIQKIKLKTIILQFIIQKVYY